MIGDSSGLRWRAFDRGVLAAEIVVHERQGEHVAVIFQLLAECVCEKCRAHGEFVGGMSVAGDLNLAFESAAEIGAERKGGASS